MFPVAPAQRNIVFVTQSFPDPHKVSCRKIYGTQFTEFNYEAALDFRKSIGLVFDEDSEVNIPTTGSSTTTTTTSTPKPSTPRSQSTPVIKTNVNNGQGSASSGKSLAVMPKPPEVYVGENKQ